jgi:hypothetical protein
MGVKYCRVEHAIELQEAKLIVPLILISAATGNLNEAERLIWALLANRDVINRDILP